MEDRKAKRQAYFAAFTPHELKFAWSDTKQAIDKMHGIDGASVGELAEDLGVIRHEMGHRAKVMRWGRAS